MGKPTSNEKPITENLALEYEMKFARKSQCFLRIEKSSHPRERWFAAYFYGRNLIGQKLFPHDTYYRNLQGHPKKERTAKLYWSVGMIIPNIWKVIKAMFQTTNQIKRVIRTAVGSPLTSYGFSIPVMTFSAALRPGWGLQRWRAWRCGTRA